MHLNKVSRLSKDFLQMLILLAIGLVELLRKKIKGLQIFWLG